MDTVGGSGIQGIFLILLFSPAAARATSPRFAPLRAAMRGAGGDAVSLDISSPRRRRACPPRFGGHGKTGLEKRLDVRSRAGCSRRTTYRRGGVRGARTSSAVRRPEHALFFRRGAARARRDTVKEKPGSSGNNRKSRVFYMRFQYSVSGYIPSAVSLRSMAAVVTRPRGTSCRTTLPRSWEASTCIDPSRSISPTIVGSRHSLLSLCPPRERRNDGSRSPSVESAHGVKPQKFIDTGLSPSSATPSSESANEDGCRPAPCRS